MRQSHAEADPDATRRAQRPTRTVRPGSEASTTLTSTPSTGYLEGALGARCSVLTSGARLEGLRDATPAQHASA